MISHVSVCLLAHEEKARFQTLSATQNGSTAFRFVRSAVLPLFLLIFAFGIVWDGMDSSRPTQSGGISDGGHREVHFFGSSDNCIFYEDLLYSEDNLAATFL